ncbi:DNA-binding protein [Geranomyces variabilis]|nr:DNA-binding protein [Geranomyces variabilis]
MQQSLNLVRNLLSTALGAVVYIRGLFPENHFKDSSLGGIALKTIERNVSPQSDELLNWLEKGCYDALERRYLKTMIFGIYLDPEEPEKLVEAYTFGFSYPNEDQWCLTIDANGKESHRLRTRGAVMKATSDMLRRLLILTETLRPLPENACLTMKLFYYDNITPDDYEPPYFREGDNDSKYYFASPPERVKTGLVETPYHA